MLILEPFQTPVAIVPSEVRLLAVTLLAKVVPVSVPAAAATLLAQDSVVPSVVKYLPLLPANEGRP